MAEGEGVLVRMADERDVPALCGLRRAWAQEQDGAELDDPGFERSFAAWWRTEMPRRAFWIAEVGSERVGKTAVGSLNVVEFVPMPMPRPGSSRGGRWGYVGNAIVLSAFTGHGVARALLGAALLYAGERGYRRLVLSPGRGSAEFYQRVGFQPAGDSILVLPRPARSGQG